MRITTAQDSDFFEARRHAMEKLGLETESQDYNLNRILQLARQLHGACATAFSVPVNKSAAFVAADGLNLQNGIRASKGCAEVLRTGKIVIQPTVAPMFSSTCPALGNLDVCSYVGVPVLRDGSQTIGVISWFFDHSVGTQGVDEVSMNNLVRLLEDSLDFRALGLKDALTNLYNRRHLIHQAEAELRRAARLKEPLSFAIVDVDWFKSFNDVAGHAAGDRALISVAHMIEQSFRRAGDCVCRYGGEEFAIIIPMTPTEEAIELVDKMRRRVYAGNIHHPARYSPLSVSAGISTLDSFANGNTGDFSLYFKQADIALYAAKENGRNRVVHYEKLPAEVRPRSKDNQLPN
ncbi:diguanylate cyclase (GGDEF)-like protein [Litorivivens lipolytica]|uniref:diguanylate cyclase n=1 Tax=Litorivivens lipolytica TaxID=1524264 RepID=A0A7W4W6V2_9GAMM|nr:sensor domain-containing diguanylate cyclase [Litorivivens lipolytica]MBB3047937.1 diguanylate cyclase (GGDEF)-like protein [Litorivivens lipolytica]